MRNTLLRPRYIAVCRWLKSPTALGRIRSYTVYGKIKNRPHFFPLMKRRHPVWNSMKRWFLRPWRLPAIICKAVAMVKGGLASRSCSCDFKVLELRRSSPCWSRWSSIRHRWMFAFFRLWWGHRLRVGVGYRNRYRTDCFVFSETPAGVLRNVIYLLFWKSLAL